MTKYDPRSSNEIQSYDLEYRRVDEEVLLARIYQPSGNGIYPALLDVHGGAWSGGSREMSKEFHERLAATGLTVVAVDFRLAPQYPYPAQVEDVNYATRWLRRHASELRADVSCLGGIGSSSGGHTLMLSTMRPRDPRYAAAAPELDGQDATIDYAILRWPVLDSYARYLHAKSASARLAAATEGYFLTEDAMREGSPTLILERRERAQVPPVLIVQGTADNNIPMSIPEAFVAAYRRAGGQLALELFPGQPHGFMSQPGPETERAFGLITDFVALHLAAPVAA